MLICREEDELANLLNYHFDPLNNIKHLMHVKCGDVVNDTNCPFCRQLAFSVIKRSGVEIDKQELQKYYDRLVQIFEKSINVRLILALEGIADNDLEINHSLNGFVKRFKDQIIKLACKNGKVVFLKLLIVNDCDVHANHEFIFRNRVENGHSEIDRQILY